MEQYLHKNVVNLFAIGMDRVACRSAMSQDISVVRELEVRDRWQRSDYHSLLCLHLCLFLSYKRLPQTVLKSNIFPKFKRSGACRPKHSNMYGL